MQPSEPDPRGVIATAYASALSAYVGGAGEVALAQAYELGRRAVSEGVGVLEIAVIHHEALGELLENDGSSSGAVRVRSAAHFFAEALAPFEMALRADVALRKAKDAADAANRELESFSYSVAHDLRAPLRSIDGFSQALLEDCADQLNEDGKRYLEYVRESAQHMGHLIDSLLALSRLTRSDVHRTDTDMSVMARTILDRLRAADRAREVDCAVADQLHAFADAHLLNAALENLIGNAWKFTGRRTNARIEIGVQPDTQPPAYYVRDNGAGFDMAHATKLFGVFQRLHQTTDFEGTGIGLATVHRIVRRHGGRIWAEAEVGRGATFYFTLEDESLSA